MPESNDTSPTQVVACDVCLKEVPLSEAKSEEATDYVAHFCGLECFEQWKQHSEEAGSAGKPEGSKPKAPGR